MEGGEAHEIEEEIGFISKQRNWNGRVGERGRWEGGYVTSQLLFNLEKCKHNH